jgi:hypothetical protein
MRCGVEPTSPPSLAVRVHRDGAIDELTIWPASGRKGKDYRTDILMVHPEGVADLRTGLTNGAILDLPPGLRGRLMAHIKVVAGATAIHAEDITPPVGERDRSATSVPKVDGE